MFKSWVTVISEQCQEVKQAISSCSYFKGWEPEEISECSRVSFIKEYSSDQIILGPDIGNSYSVFFILNGVCKMVQYIQVKVERSPHGSRVYKLNKFSDFKTSNFESAAQNFSSRLFNRNDFFGGKLARGTEIQTEEEQNDLRKQSSNDNNGTEEEKREANTSDPHVEGSNNPVTEGITGEESSVPDNKQDEILTDDSKKEDHQELDISTQQESKIPVLPVISEPKKDFAFEPNRHLKILEECLKKRKETGLTCTKGSIPEKSKNVKGFFVQTGLLFKGACFGLEKCKKQNFIMSATKVKCLVIPKRFLFKHKPCYIWDKIRLFHSLYLPKEEDILEHLRTDRMWIRNKKKLSKEIVSTKSIPNYTLINEVPYSMRLEEIKATVFSLGDTKTQQK